MDATMFKTFYKMAWDQGGEQASRDAASEVKGLLGSTALGKELGQRAQDKGAVLPGEISPRRMTDFLCLLVLLLCSGFLGYVSYYAVSKGDLRRLHHGFDFLGNLCGVDEKADSPFLYYCVNDSPGARVATSAGVGVAPIDLAHPICISTCPTSSATAHPCYAGHSTTKEITDEETQSYKEVVHVDFKEVMDYPTYIFGGRYCMPLEQNMLEQVEGVLMDRYGNRILLIAMELANAWEALAASAVIAVVLGFLYLMSLEYLAKFAVYAALFVPFLLFTAAGSYLVVTSQNLLSPNALPTFGIHTKSLDLALLRHVTTGNHDWDLVVGLGCIIAGLCFAFIACCCKESINTATGCVDAACQCLRTLPSVLLNPVFAIAAQLGMLMMLFVILLFLIACGEVEGESMDYYLATPAGGSTKGLARSFTYTEAEHYYIPFFLFMMFWLFELVGTIARFALIYATELWYFTPYVAGHKRALPMAPLLQGVRMGLQYHLGSLAIGSFLIATLRILRIIGSIIAKHEQEQGNKTTAVMAKSCVCFIQCFQNYIEYLNLGAYMEVALHSKDFCAAATDSHALLCGKMLAVGLLNGVTWVFTIAGLGVVSAAGAFVTHILLMNVSAFNDPKSESYVENPMPVVIASAVFAAICAWTFMSVFDTVSDTILYCFVVDEESHKGSILRPQYAPDSLKFLIQAHSHDGDRAGQS